MSNKSLNILIVEDEQLAVNRLQLLLEQQDFDYQVKAVANSIADAVDIINTNSIDLGFFDIQIEDGVSLDIFNKTEVRFPVIFTTAFNEYAVKAFKFNSIDYLLKPVSADELKNALNKYHTIWQSNSAMIKHDVVTELKQILEGNYKERFSVKTGNKYEIIKVENISFFYSLNKGTFIKTTDNRDLLIDSALDIVMPLLNPSYFFRISRKFIVNIECIIDVYAYSNSRLRVNMVRSDNHELIVSREKVRTFKNWLEN